MKIAEARAEEKTYEKFEQEQNVDRMHENLEDVKVELASTPISSGVQGNDQAILKVPSEEFQSSTVVSSSSITISVTTPALASIT